MVDPVHVNVLHHRAQSNNDVVATGHDECGNHDDERDDNDYGAVDNVFGVAHDHDGGGTRGIVLTCGATFRSDGSL